MLANELRSDMTGKKSTRASAAKATAKKVKEPARKNLDIYGAPPLPWARALKELEGGGGTYWLATTKSDGRPHVAATGALWVDGKIYIVTGGRTRKGRNLAARANCVVSVSLTGIDLVFEGAAVRVTDRPTLRSLAARYVALGWPVSVSGTAFTAAYSAPSAGPPPWNLYVFTPTTVFGVATADPSGATRWQFKTTGRSRT
jgi:hypothetical protein